MDTRSKTTGFLFLFILLQSISLDIIAQAEEERKNNPDTALVVYAGYRISQAATTSGSLALPAPYLLRVVPSGSPVNQLQGRVPGATITGNGQPGSTSKIRIRGIGSFTSNDPLYVVDGVPVKDISWLNPADIISLAVLKDAGAAGIYGSRASGGVIEIRTAPGNRDTRVVFESFTGIQMPGEGTRNYVLTAEEYADLQWLVYKNDGTTETHPNYGPSTNPEPELPFWASDTDWYDVITDKAGMQGHNLSVSGGSESARYFASFGFFGQDGVIRHTWADKYNARFNSSFRILKGRITFGENLSLVYRSNNSVPNLEEGSPILTGPYRSQAIIPVIWTQADYTGLSHLFTTGDYGGTGIAPRLGQAKNALAELQRAKDNLSWNAALAGSGWINISLLNGLSLRSLVGGTAGISYFQRYNHATYENSENAIYASLEEGASYGTDWVWTNTLNFERRSGYHYINGLAGYEALSYGIGRNISASAEGYFSDDPDFRTLTNGSRIRSATSSYFTPTRMFSVFAAADYSYKDKYLFSASIRRDGCSRFGKDNRFGVFPAFSAGWRIGREAFMERLNFVSDLKIRGSYGVTGNQYAVSPQSNIYLFAGDVTTSYYDLYGTGNSAVQGFYPVQSAYPGIKWESAAATNLGMDARLFDNKLTILFDWYTKTSSDVLSTIEVSALGGVASQRTVNISSVRNSGIDFEVEYNSRIGPVEYRIGANITAYRNEITKISDSDEFFYSGESRIGPIVRNAEGYPVSGFYGYKADGLFQSQAEINAAPKQDGSAPGFLRFANLDTLTAWSWETGGRRPYISTGDKTFIGDPNPGVTYGINAAICFRGFDLSAFFYGSHGNDIFNFTRWWTDFWPSFQGQKSKALLYDSWVAGRPGTGVPKASNISNFSTNTQVCSYYVEDGSYLRLKSLSLGYSLAGNISRKAGINSFYIYVRGINLFTITKYSGLDPEIGGKDLAFGIDYGNYPSVKQLLLGIKVTL